MREKILLCLVISSALFHLDARGDFAAKYDRFTDKTELWAPSMEVMDRELNRQPLALQAFTNFGGKKVLRSPPTVRIAFRGTSKSGWRYMQCHHVNALAGGKPFPLPSAAHKGRVMEHGGVFESIHVDLEWTQFAALAAQDLVEFRICDTEMKVPPGRLADWRALVKAGTPAS